VGCDGKLERARAGSCSGDWVGSLSGYGCRLLLNTSAGESYVLVQSQRWMKLAQQRVESGSSGRHMDAGRSGGHALSAHAICIQFRTFGMSRRTRKS